MKRIIIALFALCLGLALPAQTKSLPTDPEVRIGKLPNGLTYYIRHNEEPKDLAYFYIAQKVGSIQENPDQRGLAHFLEHMCFNGTTHFPGNGLREYLQKIGVQFGGDLNAYTAVDETVYNIDNVPVKNYPEAIDSCLWILHDWSNDLTLDPEEIDKERGVIKEEWRMRNSAGQRLNEKALPVLMSGSKYSDCMPIGSMDIVESFKPSTLRAYYEKWYRPDLQGIVVVGDIDVDEVERKIESIFSDIPAPGKKAATRVYYPVPDNKKPIFFIGTDKEYSTQILTVYFKNDALPREENNTEKALINSLLDSQIDDLFHSRTSEITQTENAPFTMCTGRNHGYYLSNTKSAFTLNISVGRAPGATERGFKAAIDEVNRMRRHGFTASEWERAKADLLTGIESSYRQRDKIPSKRLVNSCVRNFLDNAPILSSEDSYQLYKRLLSTITVDDLNSRMRSYFGKGDTNLAFCYFGPEREDVATPTQEDLWNWYKDRENVELEPYDDKMDGVTLLPVDPVPGKVTGREVDEAKGETTLTLSNGVKVVLRKTDFRKDRISFEAISRGGSSLVPEEDYKYMGLLNTALGVMGLGNLSWAQLQKYNAGVRAGVSAGIGDNIESVTGNCSPQFVKNMLEMVHAAFLYPNNDEQAFKALIAKLSENTRHRTENNPGALFGEAVSFARYGRTGYTASLSSTEYERADYGKLLELYKQRFADAGDFEFVLQGDLDEEAVTPWIEKYIASLPASGRHEEAKPIKKFRKGLYETYFETEQENPTSRISMLYTAETEYNLRNYLLSSILGQVMSIVYTRTIREDAGAAYSVSCGGDNHIYPESYSQLSISFTTQPDKKDLAIGLVKSGLEDVAKNGPRQEDLDKVTEYLQKVLEGNRTVDDYWSYIRRQEWYTGVNLDEGYEDVLGSITPADVAAFASEMLSQRNLIQVVMNPTPEQ